MGLPLPLPAVLVLMVLIAVREAVHWYFRGSSLANLPGPSSASWLTGTLSVNTKAVRVGTDSPQGHTRQLYDRQGWMFHLKTVVSYGSAVRLRGYLGVSHYVHCSLE